MLIPITKDHVARPVLEDRSVSEFKLRYNDQPKKNELCVCGKNKIYSRCCGKTTKTKYKEIIVTFISKEDTENYHIELTSEGVCLYTDGKKAKILSSEIVTAYERTKSPKVLNKISIPELTPLITPDNLFQYFKNILAIDTNTDKVSGISVCAVTYVLPDKGSTSSTLTIDPRNGQMTAGRCSGRTITDAIFAFKAGEHKPENVAWHIVIESIKCCSDFIKGQKYALIIDSDLSNIENYNLKSSAYFLNYSLPDNINLIYASSDNKSNSLLNFSIAQSDKDAQRILKDKKTDLAKSLGDINNPAKTTVNFLHINDSTVVFAEYAKLKKGLKAEFWGK